MRLQPWFPAIAWAGLAAALACVPGCDEGEPAVRDARFKAVYRYQLSQSGGFPDGLTFASWRDGTPYLYAVSFPRSGGLAGLYNRDTGVASIASGSELVVETDLSTPLIGSFRVDVVDDLLATPSGEFSSGSWRVVLGDELVRAEVVTEASIGVAVSLDGGAAVFLPWDEFSELFGPDSEAPKWQQAASASFLFMRIASLQARIAFQTLVDAKRVAFTNAPDIQACSLFPGTPPSGVLNQGEHVLTWLGSAKLGFHLRFTECWDDLPGEAQDYIHDGELELAGWDAQTYFSSDTLVRLGFDNVSFLDLDIVRTIANSSDGRDLDPASGYNMTGGFSIVFREL